MEENVSSKGNRVTRSWSGTELGEVHVAALGSMVASEIGVGEMRNWVSYSL